MASLIKYEVVSCPTTELSYTNKAILNPQDGLAEFPHIAVGLLGGRPNFVFSITTDGSVDKGTIAFNYTGRKWAGLMTKSIVEAGPYEFEPKSQCIGSITFLVEFASKKNAPVNIDFDSELMAKQFSAQFYNQAFTVGQFIGFVFQLENRKVVFELKVKEMDFINLQEGSKCQTPEIGLTTANSIFLFEAAPNSDINLVGGKTGKVSAPKIFNQNWDLSALGIGGLSKEFNTIFRRAFASRLLPPEFAHKIGEDFARGVLLYGPPGTGKTLIARQIGNMLLSREPKIVNGPEIFNKFVGESEANIRKLFAEAEEEQARAGIHSGLHVIIMDEIDSICKARGNTASSAGVGDNVVNQLLSKIDGVSALHNVLLIGMTNRKDLIDEALLRPGRLEIQIEVGLPNRDGRLEILKIHTKKLRENNILPPTVSLENLADLTRNYSGAELAGLIRAARSAAVSRVIDPGSGINIDEEALSKIIITWEDFEQAMKDVKPALGASEDKLTLLAKPVIQWDPIIESLQERLDKIIRFVRNRKANRPHFVCLIGKPGTGKTTLAANMAAATSFPFIRIYQAEATAGDSEMTKINYMKKLFDDASKSELSCIVMDDLQNILDYSKIGPRFSNLLRTVFVTRNTLELANNRKMLVICTCHSQQFLDDLELYGVFNHIISIPAITKPEHVRSALLQLREIGNEILSSEHVEKLVYGLRSTSFRIGVKNLEQLIEEVCELDSEQRVEKFLELISEFGQTIHI